MSKCSFSDKLNEDYREKYESGQKEMINLLHERYQTEKLEAKSHEQEKLKLVSLLSFKKYIYFLFDISFLIL